MIDINEIKKIKNNRKKNNISFECRRIKNLNFEKVPKKIEESQSIHLQLNYENEKSL